MMAPDAAVTADATPKAKRKRRWLQYSLRTLLVLMLVLGCGLGWLAYKIKRAREQRQAVEAIEKLGGNVQFDIAGRMLIRHGPASGRMIRAAVAWLGKLCGEDLSGDMTGVILSGTQVGDEGLVHLQGLTRLRTLDLANTQVRGAGLTHLRGLTHLLELSLANTQIGDEGLVYLRGLTQLWELGLAKTQVSDAGVDELKKAKPTLRIIR